MKEYGEMRAKLVFDEAVPRYSLQFSLSADNLSSDYSKNKLREKIQNGTPEYSNPKLPRLGCAQDMCC